MTNMFFPLNSSYSFQSSFQARESYLRRYDVRREFDDSYTSVLGLHFDVLPRHFRRGVMQLKCTSTLLSVYWQSSEVSEW